MKSSVSPKVAASFALALIAGIPTVKLMEGRSLSSYFDTGGVPTICDGITRYADGKPVKLGQTRTDQECDELLADELGKAIKSVDQSVFVHLTPEQRAGLGSFVYNVGPTAFRKSTMRTLLNQGNFALGCDQMRRWVFVKGKDCRIKANRCGGIVRRREREREMCLDQDGVNVLTD